LVLTWLAVALVAVTARAADTPDLSSFATNGRNDYFPLEPNYQLVLEGTEQGKPARLIVSVLNETKKIDGVETRVIERHKSLDGKRVELTRRFVAVEKKSGDIYCFEDQVTAGPRVKLLMPANPRIAIKAQQPTELQSVSERAVTPAGTFENCIKMLETSPDGKSERVYAAGVGLVIDGPLKLVKHGKNIAPKRFASTVSAQNKAKAQRDPKAPEPLVPHDLAREALKSVGADAGAETVWITAINDPGLTSQQRSDLIEDLNEEGFADPKHVTPDELPLVLNRIELIEQLAPDAMDQTNLDAFEEAYKDLTNIAEKLMQK
jgi:hypothetical protein